MVKVLDLGAEGLGLIPGWVMDMVHLDEVLYMSVFFFLLSEVQMGGTIVGDVNLQ